MTTPPNTTNSKQRWRDVLPIHPAAELFPLMTEAELRELTADIEKHGLRERVDLYRNRETQDYEVMDGRNRLDALELLGRLDDINHQSGDIFHRINERIGEEAKSFDPYAFVVSKNLHRRHLTVEQKKEIVAKLLAANPNQSNRQVAKTTGVDHKTVAAVRAEGEATGEIPQLEKTVGKDGKARPAKRSSVRDKILFGFGDPEPVEQCSIADLEKAAAKAAPKEDATKAIEAMRAAWREVELHADANNTTMLKAAIGNLITKASGALKVMGALQ